MVKTGETGPNIAPFLAKCYEMVDDDSTDKVISWSQSGDSFVIWDMTEFSRDLLPRFFKHSNFSSFMRQLNIYGFRKMGFDQWEFYNEHFIKGQKHLMSNIKRRKHLHSSAQQKAPPPPQEEQPVEVVDTFDFSSLEKEVETLKTDKNTLMQELVKLREHQASSQNKLLVLRERLQGMETNQQQLLSFLMMVMQNPALLTQLLQSKEHSWRMAETGKITIKDGYEENNVVNAEGMIVRYQPPAEEAAAPAPAPVFPPSESEKKTEHDLSMEDFFTNIDFSSFAVDESFLWSQPRPPLTAPELDLSKLEQFLLGSPTRSSDENNKFESKEPGDAEMEASEPRHENHVRDGDLLSENLDFMIEQFGLVSPGRDGNKEKVLK